MKPQIWKISLGVMVIVVALVPVVMRLTRRVPPYSAQATDDSRQAILDESVKAYGMIGVQAAVITPSGAAWSGASGSTDLARRVDMTAEDVIRVGSVTKTFTAVLIMQLVEEGRLSLDDTLDRWHPEYPGAEQVTVRMLLNHSSGIEEIIPRIMARSIIGSTYWETAEVVAIGAEPDLLFEPGTQFSYSNTNYILLGLIAEDVAGQSAADLLRARILDPLGLAHTAFIPYEDVPGGLVTGYDRDLSHFPGMLDITPANTSWATSAYTSGAMASNAGDLARFFAALFGGELVSADSLAEMTAFIDAPNPGFDAQVGYGLGLMQLEVDGVEYVGHLGQFMGSEAIGLYAPETGEVIAVTGNLSNPPLAEIVARLHAAAR